MPLPPLPLPVPVFPIRRIYFALTAGHSLRRALARGTSRRLPMCKNSGFAQTAKRAAAFSNRCGNLGRQGLRRRCATATGGSHGGGAELRPMPAGGLQAHCIVHNRNGGWQAMATGAGKTARPALQYGPFHTAIRPVWQCETADMANRPPRQPNKTRAGQHGTNHTVRLSHCIARYAARRIRVSAPPLSR